MDKSSLVRHLRDRKCTLVVGIPYRSDIYRGSRSRGSPRAEQIPEFLSGGQRRPQIQIFPVRLPQIRPAGWRYTRAEVSLNSADFSVAEASAASWASNHFAPGREGGRTLNPRSNCRGRGRSERFSSRRLLFFAWQRGSCAHAKRIAGDGPNGMAATSNSR